MATTVTWGNPPNDIVSKSHDISNYAFICPPLTEWVADFSTGTHTNCYYEDSDGSLRQGFRDDFDDNDISDWSAKAGTWAATDGWVQHTDATTPSRLTIAYTQNAGKYVYRLRVKANSSSGTPALGFFMQSDGTTENQTGDTGYIARLRDTAAQILKISDGTLTIEAQDTNYTIANGETWDLMVTYDTSSGEIRFYRRAPSDAPAGQWTLMVNWTDSSPLTSGSYIWLRVGASTDYFDNLEIHSTDTATWESDIININQILVSGNTSTLDWFLDKIKYATRYEPDGATHCTYTVEVKTSKDNVSWGTYTSYSHNDNLSTVLDDPDLSASDDCQYFQVKITMSTDDHFVEPIVRGLGITTLGKKFDVIADGLAIQQTTTRELLGARREPTTWALKVRCDVTASGLGELWPNATDSQYYGGDIIFSDSSTQSGISAWLTREDLRVVLITDIWDKTADVKYRQRYNLYVGASPTSAGKKMEGIRIGVAPGSGNSTWIEYSGVDLIGKYAKNVIRWLEIQRNVPANVLIENVLNNVGIGYHRQNISGIGLVVMDVPEGRTAFDVVNDVLDSIGGIGKWYVDENDDIQVPPIGNFIASYIIAQDYGAGTGELYAPHGVFVIDLWGSIRIYLVDRSNSKVAVYDMGGNFLFEWGSNGSGNGQFDTPNGLWISKGEVFVVDTDNHRIQVFDLEGNYLRQFGSPGAGNGELSSPQDVILSGDYVYVTDHGNDRIAEFDRNGTWQSNFGTLELPYSITMYNNEIYVLEDYLLEVQGSIHVFDESTKTQDRDLPLPAFACYGIRLFNDRIYTVGGYPDANSNRKIYVLNKTTGDVEDSFGDNTNELGGFLGVRANFAIWHDTFLISQNAAYHALTIVNPRAIISSSSLSFTKGTNLPSIRPQMQPPEVGKGVRVISRPIVDITADMGLEEVFSWTYWNQEGIKLALNTTQRFIFELSDVVFPETAELQIRRDDPATYTLQILPNPYYGSEYVDNYKVERFEVKGKTAIIDLYANATGVTIGAIVIKGRTLRPSTIDIIGEYPEGIGEYADKVINISYLRDPQACSVLAERIYEYHRKVKWYFTIPQQVPLQIDFDVKHTVTHSGYFPSAIEVVPISYARRGNVMSIEVLQEV